MHTSDKDLEPRAVAPILQDVPEHMHKAIVGSMPTNCI